MIRKIERYWSDLVEEILADPKLTEAEAEFLETVPDVFKATEDDFLIASEIVERSLLRRGRGQPMMIRPPTITDRESVGHARRTEARAHCLPSSFGSLAMLLAIRRASSLVRTFAVVASASVSRA